MVAVLLFHAGHLRGGFLGVDLFFVLSGFLITSLLLVEREATGAIGLGAFWGRRFRRLLPALLVVLVAVAVYGAVAMPATELGDLRRDALGTLGYVANWVAIRSGGDYWAVFRSPSPLEHTWSLAIEEQFYVLWPLVVGAALWLGRGRRATLATVTGLLVAASVLSLQVHHHPGGDTARAYYGSDTRMAAILYGAVVALVVAGRPRRRQHAAEVAVAWAALPAAAVLLVAWARAGGTDTWLYTWGFPLLGVSAAVVIAAVTGPRRSVLHPALEWRVTRHLGLVSYGLYLWHWPAYVVLDADRTGLDGWALTLVRVAASLLLAEVSLVLVERPVRAGRVRVARWPAALTAMALTAVVVLVATGDARPRPPAAVSAPADVPAVAPGDPRPRLLLVGDSGAALMGDALAAVGAEAGVVVAPQGSVGCGIARAGDGVVLDGRFVPDPDGCDGWPERWAEAVGRFDPTVSVLLIGWPGMGDREVDGEPSHPCGAAFDRYYQAELDTALRVLGRRGGSVALVTVPYAALAPEGHDRADCLNDLYRSTAAQHTGVKLLDLARWTCPHGRCLNEVDGVVLRPDGVHFEGDGAMVAARWLLAEALGDGAAAPTPTRG